MFLFNNSRYKLEKAHEYFHLKKYSESLNLYEQVINSSKSSKEELCEAWYCLGECYYVNSQKANALSAFENAISIGKPIDEIFAYHAQGKTFKIFLESEILNDNTEECGRDLCNSLYSLHFKYPHNSEIKRLLSNSLGDYATYTRQIGKVKDSIKIHLESLKLTDDSRMNCIGYKQLGLSLLFSGDAENAKLAFEKSMTYTYILPDGESLIAIVMYEYGLALHSLGYYSEAIQKFEESKERAEGDKISELFAEHGLGIVYQSIGLPDEAEKKFLLVESYSNSISDDFRANNLYYLCRTNLSLGKISEASDIVEKTILIGKESNKITHRLNGILLKSTIHELNKKWDASSELLLQGLNLVNTTEDIVKTINFIIAYSYSLVPLKKINEAQKNMEDAFNLSIEVNVKDSKIKSLIGLGYIYYIKGDNVSAEQNLIEAIRLSEEIRNKNEFNIQSYTSIQDTYYIAIILIQNIHVKNGNNKKALLVNDYFKFRNITIDTKSNIIFDNEDLIEDLKTICIKQRCLIFVNSLTFTNPFTLENPIIRTWCITKEGIIFIEENDAKMFSEHLQYGDLSNLNFRAGRISFQYENDLELKQLSKVLIQPFEKLLNSSIDKLIFVPDSTMASIPFAALSISRGEYLVEDFEIQITHSLSHLVKVSQSQISMDENDNIMAIGNPITNLPYIQNLPYAEKEAKYIASLYKNNLLLIGDDATKQNFIDNLNKYNIIHIAAHSWGEYDTMKGFSGTIFLSPNSVYPNGIVDANEIVEKKLINKLVVLSSCKSSLGSLRSGGMLGFSMSFLLSGAKNVVSSLWSVNDESTFYLMKEFYTSLLYTNDCSKALKNAILQTKKIYPKYLDWAGFYLYI